MVSTRRQPPDSKRMSSPKRQPAEKLRRLLAHHRRLASSISGDSLVRQLILHRFGSVRRRDHASRGWTSQGSISRRSSAGLVSRQPATMDTSGPKSFYVFPVNEPRGTRAGVHCLESPRPLCSRCEDREGGRAVTSFEIKVLRCI